MADQNATRTFAAVNDDGYLVPLHANTARQWRESFKKIATIFYGWILWTSLNSGSPMRSGELGGAVLGAGREIPAPINFEPTNPKVHEAMLFYYKLASTVRQAGARLLVVYVPLSYAIHRGDESRWRLLGMGDISQRMAFDAAFVRYLIECQIPSINLTQQFRKSARSGKRMYYWLDIHWTAAGNAAAALAVADYLTGRP
jgi:hypothetical protein